MKNNVLTLFFFSYEVKILQMAFNSLMYELIIDGVQEEDFGEYRCSVRNDLGRSSATIMLRGQP